MEAGSTTKEVTPPPAPDDVVLVGQIITKTSSKASNPPEKPRDDNNPTSETHPQVDATDPVTILRSELIYLPGKINGIEINGLLDTGSESNVMAKRMAQLLSLDIKSLNSEYAFVFADGNKSDCAQFTNVDFMVDGYIFNIDVLIGDMSPLILGRPFLLRKQDHVEPYGRLRHNRRETAANHSSISSSASIQLENVQTCT